MLNTVSALDDGSLGTNGSLLPPVVIENTEEGAGEDDCISEDSLTNEAEWRMVTDRFETQSLNGSENNSTADSGVLILDGEEPEATVVAETKVDNSIAGSGMNLSVLGADSVPTIVGSIDGFAAEGGQVSTATQTPSESNSATGSSTANNEAPSISVSKSRFALFLVPTVALFLVPTFASVRLYRERNDLLVSVARFEEEIQSLKDEAEKKKREEALLWESCKEKSKQETTLVDNCWLSAKANVQLGACANDYKEKAIDFSSSLLERLELLGNSSWIDTSVYDLDDVSESVARMMRKVDSLGKQLWDKTSIKQPHAEREDGSNFQASSFLSKMETSGKAQWKDTMKDVKSAFFTLFSSAEEEATTSSTTRASKQSDAIDDVVRGITDIVAAAGSLSVAAGEALVAVAVEKATEAIDFNQSSVNELVEMARQAFEEASLTHSMDK